MTELWGLTIALMLKGSEFWADSRLPADQPGLEAARDEISRPALSRVMASPDRGFFLVLQFLPPQQRSEATLYEVRGDRCQPVWQTTLPHAYGPRYALVNNQGYMALVDEWINVRSPHALTILDRAGEVLAQYAYEDLRSAVGRSDAEILDQTQAGWWISDLPRLSDDGLRLVVGIGGQPIQVSFSTGQLDPVPN